VRYHLGMGYLESDVSDLMAAAKMKEHAPYTEADWQADCERVDQGEPLTCPDCGALGDYGPRDDGQGRHYRACKMCGFWQETDGSPAYRCWVSTHRCDPGLDGPYDCEYCQRTDLTGSHKCGKFLTPWEHVYTCDTCGQRLSGESWRPWPLQGSG